ncbi:Mitochondrial zinc maintenance protein 1, mitochondrial [Recurvomyces mirabilis]|uniref:Mitochondrial zinc maintenance protein 1, mitochondrial n=1 Tax=Recurvomyces mirabilis TaxID=574656 RepID=A0AAE0WXJ7_9PEZI|nr:Mitochondrial zinc maintenance protein 1, mitochondrial [Recurvomyces mirabilis]KAK5158973.1 Mitochondrial zinc maintenance protein 1, mitochondrial [Recurvomyces mirabilis]
MATRFLSPAEIQSNAFAARATYRHLVRAINLSFRGDRVVYPAAIQQAREGFIQNRKLESGSIEATQAIEHAQGVAQILRENVVQGASTGDDKYKLRFTKYTQRMDNAKTKELKGTTKSFKEIKSAQF